MSNKLDEITSSARLALVTLYFQQKVSQIGSFLFPLFFYFPYAPSRSSRLPYHFLTAPFSSNRFGTHLFLLSKRVVLAFGEQRRSCDLKAAVVGYFADLREVGGVGDGEAFRGYEGLVERVVRGGGGAAILHCNNYCVDYTVKINTIFINRISLSKETHPPKLSLQSFWRPNYNHHSVHFCRA